MCRILDGFSAAGNTIIYVSHESSFINRYPGTIYIVEDGRLKPVSGDEGGTEA
jgi:ABC-type ATPase involved in cell division